MRYTTIHTIVTGLLIRRQYPIHYYMQFLFEATRAFEELHFDSLKNIQTVRLTADEFYSVQLPCDSMDLIKVGVPNGQFVRNLYHREGINSLYNYDDADNKTLYPSDGFDISTIDKLYFYNTSVYPYDARGLRFFGIGSNDDSQSFKYIHKENRIQLNQKLGTKEVIVQYIDAGTKVDNATMIDPRAKATIEAYIIWQMKESSRIYGEGERERAKKRCEAEHAKFRARKNDLGKEEIIALFRGAAKGSVKL